MTQIDEFGGDEYGDTLDELLREWDDTDVTIDRLMDTDRMGRLIELLRQENKLMRAKR